MVFTLQQSDKSPLPPAPCRSLPPLNKNTTSASHSRSVNTSFNITEQPPSRASPLSTAQIRSLLHLLPYSTIGKAMFVGKVIDEDVESFNMASKCFEENIG
ncbi:unnamed protein product [Lactuca virosa]|uniref:Uncharacterized protein n=1 Tax=Lactuca virosa TaxID=75947 RepID=A0AAU9P3U1_9ASTR|nr:unnamed protein product [Lactuca virosa]